MMRYPWRVSLVFLSLLLSLSGFAAPAGSSGLVPEVLSAKAFLEDLLARRYTQELATQIDRQAFSLGAQLELIQLPKKEKKKEEKKDPFVDLDPISDLTLGTLDPEEILKKITPADVELGEVARSLLESFRIKSVTVAVGLRQDLGDEVKAQTEKWLKVRLNAEFGKAGIGKVTFLKLIPEKVVPPKTPIDWLNQFQSLAGQVFLALVIFFSFMLWLIFGSSSKSTQDGRGENGKSSIEINSKSEGGDRAAQALQTEEQIRTHAEVEGLIDRLKGIVPGVSNQLEGVINYWCRMGDAGRMRLSCFAEAVGRDLGKLPIPADAMKDVSAAFAKMANLDIKDKKEALQKAYWDILSVINLGSESLEQPFGYLGSLKVGMVSEILVDQNPKMKTLVSLFMPEELRASYVKSLPVEAKRELLASAAGMNEVDSKELKTLDGSIMKRIKPPENRQTIPLELSLNKLVAVLSPIEEITLLKDLDGVSLVDFKTSTPSLAFLGEWPEEKLAILLAQAAPDELTALLSVRPDLKDRLLAAAPMMTAEVVKDDLNRADAISEKEKNQRLIQFTSRLKELVRRKEIILDEVFTGVGSSNPSGGAGASKKVA